VASARVVDPTSARMTYGDRSFDQLVWPRPTNSIADWFELAAILTPRGQADPWKANRSVRSVPVASAPAARRLVLLSYAHQIPMRIVESGGHGRRSTVRRDAYFEGRSEHEVRRMLISAARRLEQGPSWLDGLRNPVGAATALWRASLICNGLIRSPKEAFTIRVSTTTRAAALQTAAATLGVEPRLVCKLDGLRLECEPAAGGKLLDRLVDGSALESFA
jgi:hypothetical protein